MLESCPKNVHAVWTTTDARVLFLNIALQKTNFAGLLMETCRSQAIHLIQTQDYKTSANTHWGQKVVTWTMKTRNLFLS